MKLKTNQLLIVLLALIAIVLLVKYINEKKSNDSLRTDFFDIDFDHISKFAIYPITDQDQKFTVFKENNKWYLEINGGNKVEADSVYALRSVLELKKMKPSRLASKNPDEWPKYGVDSIGTMLELYENNQTYKIIIGSLSFMNNRQANTYLRIPGEDETYAAENYMEGTFKAKMFQWRKKTCFGLPVEEWGTILIKGQNNSFQLSRTNSSWKLNNVEQDSLFISKFIKKLSLLENQSFSETEFGNDLPSPIFSITTTSVSGNPASTLNIYEKSNRYLLTSSINEGNVFEIDPTIVAEIENVGNISKVIQQ